MDHIVARPALPTLGLEPRYMRRRRLQTDVSDESSVPIQPPVVFDECDAGPGVDGVTGELRQRVLGAKPTHPKRLPTYLATSIAAGLAALRLGAP